MDQPNQTGSTQTEQQGTKELNFRRQQQMYEKMLAEKESRLAELEEKFKKVTTVNQDEDDGEPYVDNKKLNNKLSVFEKNLEKKIDEMAERKTKQALQEEKRNSWLKLNPDFERVIQENIEKLQQQDPELVDTLASLPDTFERQQLVYKSIKAHGLHQPKVPVPSVQDTVNANRRGLFYSPSGVASPGYAASESFSPVGQKNAYAKMKELGRRYGGS